MKKILSLIIVAIFITSLSSITFADINQNKVIAEREYNGQITPYGLFDDYNVYSDGEWIFNSNNIGVGAKGWTNITEKSDGSYRYHYTNVACYYDSAEQDVYTSGRVWGSGKVSASTGDCGRGAMHHYRIFYGW